jgi:hypothetical protein
MLLLVPVLCGCAPAKQTTFLTIQVCLGNEKSTAEFMNMMRLIARSENMNFIDGGADTKRDLEVLGVRKPYQTDPVINLGIDDKEGHNLLMGGNLDLPGYQVALAFGEGSNPAEAHRLAGEVVRRLKARWQVSTVPAGKGAFPSKTCAR